MRFRKVVMVILCLGLTLGALPARALPVAAAAQASQLSVMQRLDVMRSKLDTMRRTLNSALAGLNAKDKSEAATGDDPRARLGGLEKEAGKLLGEVADLRGKQERAERFDPTTLDKLEAAVTDIDNRVQGAMRETARDRSTNPVADTNNSKDKKKGGGGFLGLGKIFGRGGNDKYDELVGTVAPGRDRQLFEEATNEARHDNYETSRALFSVIINTYPDSVYLPLAKLAIADTFYLEGTTSALIQAGQAYQDWFTFFPTHPLSDDVMLKMGEVEMRRMVLPDRDNSPARKAEQRLKAFLQQFPKSSLRPEVEIRLREVQENLADHDKNIGDQYFNKYYAHHANNLKGAQSRYREVVEKYKDYSGMAEVLYRYATTYMEEEEPDEATKYFQQLVRKHPNCGYAEKAKEQLTAIGAAIPEPDSSAMAQPCAPEGPGFMGNIVRQISGVVPKTVDKDGVIISQSSKDDDIIADVIKNGGTLPDNYNRPVNRTAPSRDVRPLPDSAPKKDAGAKKEVSLEPTRSGAPASPSDPTKPAATQPNTPGTPPPANNSGVKP